MKTKIPPIMNEIIWGYIITKIPNDINNIPNTILYRFPFLSYVILYYIVLPQLSIFKIAFTVRPSLEDK